MKHECKLNATAPTIFSEQLSTVIDLFQQWNDCERAVMLFAVLKRVPFPLTKFLQLVIETSLKQAQCKDQAKILERNANCAKYINSLSETYKSIKFNETQLTTESYFASDRSIDNIDKCCDKKEEILRDILKMMPILTIGNDEAKSAYLDFIPMTVSDVQRRIVCSTLVQQIFCYVLIHPAFSTDDRSSVVKHLKVLENHISTNEPNIFVYRSGTSPTSEPTNPSTPSSWQPPPIAPPNHSKSTDTIPPPSPWGSSHILPLSYKDPNEYRSVKSGSIPGSMTYDELEDHHASFLKNGKNDVAMEDTSLSNTPLGFFTLPSVTSHHLTSPDMMKHGRTYRSNSLDIQAKLAPPKEDTSGKVRSFSLCSIDFGKSDIPTRDELRPTMFQLPQRHHVGMSSIAQWLKSLRLHKYVFLFSCQTYEQMMETTEDHLMNVTKGARHKLVTNIQKLRERYTVLNEMEQDLLCGQMTVAKALEELALLVITPMKPMIPFDKHDVPTQLLKVLEVVYNKMTTKHMLPQDEPYVNQLMYILDKAMHHEAFVAQLNLLKERRHNMQRIKSQFPPKIHYSKSNEASAPSNNHRQRVPLKFNDYLPKPFTPFAGMNRPVGNIDTGLPYSSAAKLDPYYGGPYQQQQKPQPQRTDDRFIFKIPAVPAPSHHRTRTISGSIESISSGYHSDGIPIGMGNIAKWLKSHRLHKYTWVFENVSYEKIFTFTEDYLKSLSITQGAAHKLANCIEKLKSRAEALKQTGLSLALNQMFVPDAVQIMESIVLSPMKPMRLNCDTDVGYQLWNVINLVYKLLASNSYDEETVGKFARVLDAATGSEAFADYMPLVKEMRINVGRLGRRMIR